MFHMLKMLGKIIRFIPVFLRQFIYECSSSYSNAFFLAIRYIIIASFVKKIGNKVYIGKNVTIRNPDCLSIGDSVSIHDNCYIDAYGTIEIGDSVSIAHNTSVLSFEHTWEDVEVPIKYNPTVIKEVKIKDDVWIGAGSRILGGTTIESRTIIAAGAVVKGLLESNSIYGGIPGKLIKKI